MKVEPPAHMQKKKGSFHFISSQIFASNDSQSYMQNFIYSSAIYF